MARVRITKKIPKALSGLEMKMSAGLYGKGTNGNSQFRNSGTLEAGKISQQPTEVRDTLLPVAREGANLEAEKGETAMVNIDGIPAHFKIGGKRHHSGGTPLNLPDNSFIFSDTAKMRIKDPILLAQFGMVPKKSGYTPAEIAKKYDINKYREVLADPNSTDVDRSTAELMISNYNMKLAKLALVQESMKGFPQGIPVVAMPYVMASGMNPEELLQVGTQGQEEQSDEDTGEAKYGGGLMKAQVGAIKKPEPTGSLTAATSYNTPLQINQADMEYTKNGVLNDLADFSLGVLEFPQRGLMYLGTSAFGDKGRYEMPSEAILRNYPQTPEGLTFAADLISPGLLRSAIKTVSRVSVNTAASAIARKAAEDAARHVATEGFKKGASKLVLNRQMAEQLLKSSGRKLTERNFAIAEKTYKAAANKAVDLLIKKPILKTQPDKLISKINPIALKTASKTSVKETSKILPEMVGEKVTQASKWTNKQIKKIAPVVAQKLEDAADFTRKYSPTIAPLKAPVARQILTRTQQDDGSDLMQNIGYDNVSRRDLYTHPKYPGKTFYLNKDAGRYILNEEAKPEDIKIIKDKPAAAPSATVAPVEEAVPTNTTPVQGEW
jgi:hypothetical protein